MEKCSLIMGAIPVALVLLLSVRFYLGKGTVVELNARLSDKTLQLPPVETLSIILLIDSQTISSAYKTEDGVPFLLYLDKTGSYMHSQFHSKFWGSKSISFSA